MRRIFRELRRAPVRILASVFALTLALGAIGVIAVPDVSTSSLRAAAERDGIAEIAVDVVDTGDLDVQATVEQVPNVDRVAGQVAARVGVDDTTMLVLGTPLDDQVIDVVTADSGRLPTGPNEILVTEGTAELGATVPVTTSTGAIAQLDVVGIGGTSYWAGEELAFTTLDTARSLSGVDGVNRLVLDADDAGADALDATVADVRDALGSHDVTMTSFPVTVPDGAHPIEEEIAQVSVMVGLLGVVAGIVALVLLASTTTTLVTERSREVAVMRALGGRRRALRRRLRRLALGIAAAAVVLGVPLGMIVANVIARMVLEEFLGLTPGVAVSIPVMVGSAAFALIGARVVAAHAARKVTSRPLAEALRDREASPYGRRLTERMVARLRLGGLLDRVALRNGLHRRAGSLAIVAQITAAVAALMVIATMVTTVNAFNDAEYAHWRWTTRSTVPGPGLDIDADVASGDDTAEPAIQTIGELDDWEVDVIGLKKGSAMIDPTLDDGRWYRSGDEVVLATGFAERTGVAIGDRVDLELSSGRHSYEVVGLHPARGRIAFGEVGALSEDLGSPGQVNALLATDGPPADVAGVVEVDRLDEITSDDSGRAAVVFVFGAIGLVIVGVAGLAVASGLAVNVFERRYSLAALQAIGGRRRHVRRVVGAELLPLAVAGTAAGVGLGYLGSLGIVSAFESADAVEIGHVFAVGAIPATAAAVIVGSLLLGVLMARRVTARPAAVTLRGAV